MPFFRGRGVLNWNPPVDCSCLKYTPAETVGNLSKVPPGWEIDRGKRNLSMS
jgi:hypothetical protein